MDLGKSTTLLHLTLQKFMAKIMRSSQPYSEISVYTELSENL